MLDQLTDSTFAQLADIADHAIVSSLVRAAAGLKKLDEVRAVEAVVLQGMRGVARGWRSSRLIHGKLHLQSVFCHAAPKVTFSRPTGARPGCCELADLLVVMDDPSAQKPEERRRAVLVQAKLHDPPGHLRLNSGNERVQFELLSGWPPFTFNAGFYKPHARDLTLGPGTSSWGGEYAGIDQPPRGGWAQYLITNTKFAPNPPIHGAVSLGQLLAGMLGGRAQFGRPAVPYGRDSWSETIQELIDVTFRRPVRGSQPGSRRGRDHVINFNLDIGLDAVWPVTSGGSGGGADSKIGDGDEWPDGAISVVRYTIGERRE